MLPLLLIDTREPEPDPEPEGGSLGAALAAALGWLYPWPAIVAWMILATLLVDGPAGAVITLVTLSLIIWRVSKAYPEAGLHHHQQ